MNKHTPGEWLSAGGIVYALSEDDSVGKVSRFMAQVSGGYERWGVPINPEELAANIALMRAAPCLLEALEEMLAVCPARPPAAGILVGIEEKHRNAINKARTAIKKARGT